MAWPEKRTGADGRVRWFAVWRDPKTRRRRSRPLGAIPEDAARARCVLIGREMEGRRPTLSDLTHRQALARFLRFLRFERRSSDTLRYYDELLSRLFEDLAARAAMRRWHPGHLQEVLARRTTWGPRTVQMAIAACRRFVRWARKARVAVPDFVEDLKGPRVAVVEVDAYARDDVAKIVEAARGHHLELPVLLAIFAGLSYGDLCAVTAADVELVRQRGRVVEAWIRRKRAKTGQPIEVALRGRAAEVLAVRLDAVERPTEPLCEGLPGDKNNAKRSLHRLLAHAGVARGGWRRLRHTFGSMLAASGTDLATIRRMMGHAPGSTMTLRYIHSDEGRISEAAAAIERLRATGSATQRDQPGGRSRRAAGSGP